MRILIPSILLATLASAAAAAPPCAAPPSAAVLLRAHPGAWRPPSRQGATLAGMRLEPETGEAAPAPAPVAPARAGAQAIVHVDAEGGTHVIVGNTLRAWTVARIEPDGRVVQTCAHSEAEALRLVRAGSPAQAAAVKAGR